MGVGLRCLLLSTLILPAAMGCASDGGETTATPTLPALQTPEPTAFPDTTPFPGSGLPPGTDMAPDQVITVSEVGVLMYRPVGGPYDSISGELRITETEPGEELPRCEVIYNLTGPVTSANCSGCERAVDVLHTVTFAEGSCIYPDMPFDGERRLMAYHGQSDRVLIDYENTGHWLPWYETDVAGDDIPLYWAGEFGFNPGEME